MLIAGMFDQLSRTYIDFCPNLLENDKYLVCYDFEYNGPIAGLVILDNKVNKTNIKKHYYFKSDLRIPLENRVFSSSYKGTPYTLGHTIVSDSSADYDKAFLKSTYLMSNITPQYPNTNKYSYLKVENYIRDLTKVYPYIEVLTLIKYSNSKIGKTSIPATYYKILKYNEYEQCFAIPNDNKIYKFTDMIIDCIKIKERMRYGREEL
jgi:endonuclease G